MAMSNTERTRKKRLNDKKKALEKEAAAKAKTKKKTEQARVRRAAKKANKILSDQQRSIPRHMQLPRAPALDLAPALTPAPSTSGVPLAASLPALMPPADSSGIPLSIGGTPHSCVSFSAEAVLSYYESTNESNNVHDSEGRQAEFEALAVCSNDIKESGKEFWGNFLNVMDNARKDFVEQQDRFLQHHDQQVDQIRAIEATKSAKKEKRDADRDTIILGSLTKGTRPATSSAVDMGSLNLFGDRAAGVHTVQNSPVNFSPFEGSDSLLPPTPQVPVVAQPILPPPVVRGFPPAPQALPVPVVENDADDDAGDDAMDGHDDLSSMAESDCSF